MVELLNWNDTDKTYKTGVSRGVVYPYDEGAPGVGVAWSGLTSVSKSPEGGERTEIYADNEVYGVTISSQKATGSIEAYQYPDKFSECFGKKLVDGAYIEQQGVKPFAFCYREEKGNDKEGIGEDYTITLFYQCYTGAPEEAAATISDSPEPVTYSFDLTCINVPVTGHKPSATFVFDSTVVAEGKMAALEEVLYDSKTKLPSIDTILALAKPGQGTGTGGEGEGD